MSEQCKRGWWTKYSENKLVEIESSILSAIKTTYKTWFVPIGSVVGNDDKIWTISLNEESKNTPLVMLHGFAAGIGFWIKNFDEIARDRPVYAIDLLGFGRSSRPVFGKDCETAEKQWVDTLEEWRKQVNLDKFILLGHSFGGYLATSYAISHPDRVRHLILADPWGFAEKPPNYKPPTRFRVLRVLLYPLYCFNPLSSVRGAGPWGPALVKRMRNDIAMRYKDTLEDTSVITDYIYQCNSQYPSGETAFNSFVKDLTFSKNPMADRYDTIHESTPITVVYGKESWIDQSPAFVLQEQREDINYVKVAVIPDAGHHIYSDQPDLFNEFVRETCKITDNSQDKKGSAPSAKLLKAQFDYDRIKAFVNVHKVHKKLTEGDIEEDRDKNAEECKVTPN
ncbi:(Lyso)-N-acylphosphatidylethanolamine lipase-like [Euwallacea fornicatus]|uniref:(Lyso)-N-acylphosphatidylethanolamine lipase-like n=1 Tax=Euwallacea fornicatus TaxID=995702 RepID=UPI00338FA3C1